MKRFCRHCGGGFYSAKKKPGFIDECPACLAATGKFTPEPCVPRANKSRFAASLKILDLPPTVKRMKSRFNGRCLGCRKQYGAGEALIKPMGVTGAWHEVCFREAQRAQHNARHLAAGARTLRLRTMCVSRSGGSQLALAEGTIPRRRTTAMMRAADSTGPEPKL